MDITSISAKVAELAAGYERLVQRIEELKRQPRTLPAPLISIASTADTLTKNLGRLQTSLSAAKGSHDIRSSSPSFDQILARLTDASRATLAALLLSIDKLYDTGCLSGLGFVIRIKARSQTPKLVALKETLQGYEPMVQSLLSFIMIDPQQENAERKAQNYHASINTMDQQTIKQRPEAAASLAPAQHGSDEIHPHISTSGIQYNLQDPTEPTTRSNSSGSSYPSSPPTSLDFQTQALVESPVSGNSPDTTDATVRYLTVASERQASRDTALDVLISKIEVADLTGRVTLKSSPPIAAGGFAAVYIAQLDNQNTLAAVKVLRAHKSPNNPVGWATSMERRLTREISVWAALKHPNILELYGYANGIGDFSAMVSKWCKNGNAGSFLQANPSTTHAQRLQLVSSAVYRKPNADDWKVQDVANGLAYLHSWKVVHGDIKPHNVLISDDGVGQLCDFGLVSLAETQGPTGLTTTSPYGGTARYKAPELVPSRDNRDPKPNYASDIYAFGCITYEFLYSRQPFHDKDNIYEILEALRDYEPPAERPNHLDDRADIFLWSLLEAYWSPNPLERLTASQSVTSLNMLRNMYHP